MPEFQSAGAGDAEDGGDARPAGDTLPPWVADSEYMTPLLAAYDARIKAS